MNAGAAGAGQDERTVQEEEKGKVEKIERDIMEQERQGNVG